MKQPSEEARNAHQETAGQAPDRGGSQAAETQKEKARAREIGGCKGAEPTRFGDWEKDGRCIDF